MMFRTAGVLIALSLAPSALAGPLSKFDGKRPTAEFDSVEQAEVIERCLIDADQAPLVYRQPDRPDDVTLLWTSGAGVAVFRVDLRRTAKGTHIRSWQLEKILSRCASPG